MGKNYLTTLPALLERRAKEHPDRVALREKEWGVWQNFTWREYRNITAEFAQGIKSLGFGPGDVLILIGDNRPEWLWAEVAAQSLGGMALGLYQDAPGSEIEFIFTLTKAGFVVAEDQEQVDKILELKPGLPDLQHIIYHDPRGLSHYKAEGLSDFQDIRVLGRDKREEFSSRVRRLESESPALITITSGTTGRPKLAMLSHKNLLAMAHNLGQADPKLPSDDFVSFLPLAWIGEQMMSAASALLFGFCVNFPEEPDTMQHDIREIGPHLIFSPPRVWENMAASVRVKIMETSPLKRLAYNFFHAVGRKHAAKVLARERVGPGLRAADFLADICLFRALRDRLGFSRIRSASTGGAALGPDTFIFFHALGINLKQIYGQTEIAGISCIHRDGEVDFDSVGTPIAETEIKISEDGEILSRSPAVFLGYYENPKATAETLVDGWLKSGDAGYFKDNGQLVVIDRLKDVMQLASGLRFSPQFIENKLKFSPYIREAVVFGAERDYVTAILCIDMGIVGRWAESRGMTYTTYQDLSARPEVYVLIRNEVAGVNESLEPGTRVRRFALLSKELDADDGELTRTRKVRRGVVGERYAALVDGLYSKAASVDLRTRITYQDGSTRELAACITIMDI